MVEAGAIKFDGWELVGNAELERFDLLRAISDELLDRAAAATAALRQGKPG